MSALSKDTIKITSQYVVPTIVSAIGSSLIVHHGKQWVVGAVVVNAAIFGAAQSALAALFNDLIKPTGILAVDFFIGHLVAGSAVYGISYLAFKVGLTASVISLSGAAIVMLATAALSFGATFLTELTLAQFDTSVHKPNT